MILIVVSVILSGGTAAAEATGSAAPQLSEVGTLAWGDTSVALNGSSSLLSGVSCVGSNFCITVGNFVANPTLTQSLIERWDGTTWSLVDNPNPGDMSNQLTGVSCSNPTDCVAVGYYRNKATPGTLAALIETWNGSTWSLTASPDEEPDASLNGVSCIPAMTSETFCVAVGADSETANLIETWNGSAWSVTPSPTGVHTVDSVSCVSSSNCTAVGDYFNGTDDQNLIESWDGTSWSIASSPPAGTGGSHLSDVSCATSMNCVAVGESTDNLSTPSTLVEIWDGTSWSTSPSLDPGTNGNFLSGVSCISSIHCVAVGVTSPTSPLIESLNGASWSLVPSAISDDSNDRLTSVSCTNPINCAAVGFYGYPTTTETVARAEAPFGITSTSLPPGKIGTPYSQTIAAVGGNPPYKWKVVSGSLPSGLHHNKTTGTISGTPGKKSATSTFTVQLTDTKTHFKPKTINTATATFTITIS